MQEYAKTVELRGSALRMHRGRVMTGRPAPWALSELGVTDAAMTALWRHGPEDRTYAVSSGVEAQVLGGDLAIVDAVRTVRVYQAKLVKELDLATGEYVLKSALTDVHAGHLAAPTFRWNGQLHQMQGYLALYQRALPVAHGITSPKRSAWWARTATSVNAPGLGGLYYWDMMDGARGRPSRMATARGIMAAPIPLVPAGQSVDRVPAANSWPWEYGLSNRWRGLAALASLRRARGEAAADSTPIDDDDDTTPDGPEPLVESGGLPGALDSEREDFAARLFDHLYGDRPGSLTVVFV